MTKNLWHIEIVICLMVYKNSRFSLLQRSGERERERKASYDGLVVCERRILQSERPFPFHMKQNLTSYITTS